MSSLDYKLSEMERKDLISCCAIAGSRQKYKIGEISPLPYGYLFYFKSNKGQGYSFVVNIRNTGNKKEADVLPACNLSEKIKKSIETLLNRKEKDLLLQN